MENRKIQWDEQGIVEHDKTRGTRMKINEPKTPYNYYDEEEDTDFNDIQQAVPKLEKIKKKQEFESKRKHHYNEYEMMKQFRESQDDDDDKGEEEAKGEQEH